MKALAKGQCHARRRKTRRQAIYRALKARAKKDTAVNAVLIQVDQIYAEPRWFAWRRKKEHNEERPHSGVGYQTPSEFAAGCGQETLTISQTVLS